MYGVIEIAKALLIVDERPFKLAFVGSLNLLSFINVLLNTTLIVDIVDLHTPCCQIAYIALVRERYRGMQMMTESFVVSNIRQVLYFGYRGRLL